MAEAPTTPETVVDPITIVIDTELGPLVWNPVPALQEDLRAIAAIGDRELTGVQLALVAIATKPACVAVAGLDKLLHALREDAEKGNLEEAVQKIAMLLELELMMDLINSVPATMSAPAMPFGFDEEEVEEDEEV